MNAKMLADSSLGNMGDWQGRHNAAVSAPHAGFERAVVIMLAGWLEYAETHKAQYESAVGEDGFIGDHWQSIGESLLGLLNGMTGRLDCGTLDKLIRGTMAANGIEVE